MAGGKNKVVTATENSTAEILINNPPLNVIDTEVLQELIGAITELEAQEGVERVNIGSRVNELFSVGFDTSCVLIRMEDRMDDIFTLARSVAWLIRSSEKFYIARIQGLCLGLGLELALSCDMVIYGRNTMIGYPDIIYGMPFLTGSPWTMFSEREAELMLSGAVVAAEDASLSRFVPSSSRAETGKNMLYARRFYKKTRPRQISQIDGLLSKAYDLSAIDLKGLERFREIAAGRLNIPFNPD